MKELSMKFNAPAEDSLYGWEHHSIPLANAYMGVNLFGGVATERMQITENSLCNSPSRYLQNHYSAGLMNFAEVYIDFPHDFSKVKNYRRTLSFNTAVANMLIAENIRDICYRDRERNGRQATYKVVSRAKGKLCDRGVFLTVIPNGEEYKEVKGFGMGPGKFIKNNW